MNIKMYRIREFPIRHQIVCDNCHIKGFIDPNCNECGGKGTRNKTINVWDVCKEKETICKIDREIKEVNGKGNFRYWTSSCEFFREESNLLHFIYDDAKNECKIRNKDIQHIIKNNKKISEYSSQRKTTHIINDKFINVSFRNNGAYTEQYINMPIILDQTPIGVISEVNNDFVHGVVWRKFIIDRIQPMISYSVELELTEVNIEK